MSLFDLSWLSPHYDSRSVVLWSVGTAAFFTPEEDTKAQGSTEFHMISVGRCELKFGT